MVSRFGYGMLVWVDVVCICINYVGLILCLICSVFVYVVVV